MAVVVESVHHRKDIRMAGKNNLFIECPVCGCLASFQYDMDMQVYVSKCPNCGNLLEMEKKEYEKDLEIEYYFEYDF